MENKFELSQILIFKMVVHFCVVFVPEEESKYASCIKSQLVMVIPGYSMLQITFLISYVFISNDGGTYLESLKVYHSPELGLRQ